MVITAVPVSPLDSSDNSVSGTLVMTVAISIAAVVGVLLLIFIIFMTMLCRQKNNFRNNSKRDPQLDITMDKHKPQQHTQSQQDYVHNTDASPQRIEADKAARLATVNKLDIPIKVKPLDSFLHIQADPSRSVCNMTGCDVIIAPNPLHAINLNRPVSREKSELQYDYVEIDDELVQHHKFGYPQLADSTASDGAPDKASDPTNNDTDTVSTVYVVNPSYSLPQGGQNVILQDNPSYKKAHLIQTVV